MSGNLPGELEAKTPLASIQKKVLAYHATMNAISDHLQADSPSLRICKKDQFLQFYIDKASLAELVKISTYPKFDHIGAFFGVDEGRNNKITACFLGLDANNAILDEHKNSVTAADGSINGPQDGQEDWPPPYNGVAGVGVTALTNAAAQNCFTLATPLEQLNAYFS